MARRGKSKYVLSRKGRRGNGGRWLAVLCLLLLLAGGAYWWLQAPAKKLPPPVVVKPGLKTGMVSTLAAATNAAPLAMTNHWSLPALTNHSPPAVFTNRPLPVVGLTPPVPPLSLTPVVITNLVPPINPPATTNPFPAIITPLEAQVALARLAISPGSIDGAIGNQTRLAIRQFQKQNHLRITGQLDAATQTALKFDSPPTTTYTITAADVARLQPLGKTWLEKSAQSALDFETLVELLGEKCHAHPALIRQLNPGQDWNRVMAGTTVKVLDVAYPPPPAKAARVVIRLAAKYLEAWDGNENLLLHCPVSIAARVEKRPVGLLHVVVVAEHPNYTLDPTVFAESAEARAIGHRLILPPGPNNPVGVAWMGLDRPGYGMHGTPVPEQVGRTESHGCFRLANWDAAYLVKLVWLGLPVEVRP